jgi:hypothetical protein
MNLTIKNTLSVFLFNIIVLFSNEVYKFNYDNSYVRNLNVTKEKIILGIVSQENSEDVLITEFDYLKGQIIKSKKFSQNSRDTRPIISKGTESTYYSFWSVGDVSNVGKSDEDPLLAISYGDTEIYDLKTNNGSLYSVGLIDKSTLSILLSKHNSNLSNSNYMALCNNRWSEQMYLDSQYIYITTVEPESNNFNAGIVKVDTNLSKIESSYRISNNLNYSSWLFTIDKKDNNLSLGGWYNQTNGFINLLKEEDNNIILEKTYLLSKNGSIVSRVKYLNQDTLLILTNNNFGESADLYLYLINQDKFMKVKFNDVIFNNKKYIINNLNDIVVYQNNIFIAGSIKEAKSINNPFCIQINTFNDTCSLNIIDSKDWILSSMNIDKVNECTLFPIGPALLTNPISSSEKVDQSIYKCKIANTSIDSCSFIDYTKDKNLFNYMTSAQHFQTGIRLTKSEFYDKGAIWFKNKLKFNEYNKITIKTKAEFKLGNNNLNNDGSEQGADGIAMIFQNNNPYFIGKNGGGIGYSGIENALVIELDLFKNSELTDLNGSHISIRGNKEKNIINSDHSKDEIYTKLIESSIILNDKNLSIDIELDSSKKNLKLKIYNQNKTFTDTTLSINIFDYINTNDNQVYFGFTSATGVATQEHWLREILVCNNNFVNSTTGIFEEINDNVTDKISKGIITIYNIVGEKEFESYDYQTIIDYLKEYNDKIYFLKNSLEFTKVYVVNGIIYWGK